MNSLKRAALDETQGRCLKPVGDVFYVGGTDGGGGGGLCLVRIEFAES